MKLYMSIVELKIWNFFLNLSFVNMVADVRQKITKYLTLLFIGRMIKMALHNDEDRANICDYCEGI